MKILAIETSCDETAVCLLEQRGSIENPDFVVLGNALYSQAEKHAEYGGVYPSLARREHVVNIIPMLEMCLKEAGVMQGEYEVHDEESVEQFLEREPDLAKDLILFAKNYDPGDIDAIAVTIGPGLDPALWVGINVARSLALMWEKPLAAVNHMEGHVLSGLFPDQQAKLPALALLISGGHTEIVLIKKWGQYEKLGATRDDAVGEAFDKTARLLELPYPGGPQISKLADTHRKNHPQWESQWDLPTPMIDSDNLDFSFSGLKTAVLYRVKDKQLTQEEKESLAREFEDTVAKVIVEKTRRGLDATGAKTLLVGGGVIANTHLREELQELTEEYDVELLLPEKKLTTDNAIMIAMAGSLRAQNGNYTKPEEMRAQANWSL